MKKILLTITTLCSITLFAQKTKPVLQATFVSTIVNEGTKNHFSDNVNKRDLTFTLDAEAKLNGEIIIKNASNDIIFKGTMKDNYLVDSATWYDNKNIIKVVHFKDKCCTSSTNYVDPTPKALSAIKGEKQGIERIYYSKKAGVIKSVTNYSSGKKNGKSYEYDSTGTLKAIRTYKDDMLNDTTWINPKSKSPDMEIYSNGVPSGIWKKYNSNGGLLEVSYHSATGDSTILYGSDTKLLSIRSLSAADPSFIHTGREYDAKLKLSKLYYIKDRVDTNASVLHGMYEEYTIGKISLRGEYWLGTKIETWITFNAKGSEINWEAFTTRDVALATLVEGAPMVTTAAAVDLFPPALSKSAITMELNSNGKIEKLFKKTEEINWEFDVKSSTDHTVICNDEKLTETERADVVEYLTSCITTVKGVRYSHKEVSFVTKYKLVFK